jgi:hypothetical protein
MLRLILRSQSPEEAVLEVHGWVAGADVALLAGEGGRLLGQSRWLVVQLDGVRFIDRAGLDLLEGLSGARLQVRGGSPFVRSLLQSRRLVPGPDRTGESGHP